MALSDVSTEDLKKAREWTVDALEGLSGVRTYLRESASEEFDSVKRLMDDVTALRIALLNEEARRK